jgi:hypothetical protein
LFGLRDRRLANAGRSSGTWIRSISESVYRLARIALVARAAHTQCLRFSIFIPNFNDLLRFDDLLRQSRALNPQRTDSINAALTALLQP